MSTYLEGMVRIVSKDSEVLRRMYYILNTFDEAYRVDFQLGTSMSPVYKCEGLFYANYSFSRRDWHCLDDLPFAKDYYGGTAKRVTVEWLAKQLKFGYEVFTCCDCGGGYEHEVHGFHGRWSWLKWPSLLEDYDDREHWILCECSDEIDNKKFDNYFLRPLEIYLGKVLREDYWKREKA